MSVRYSVGDVVDAFQYNLFDTLIHGCNCFNTMGAGIALQIAHSFPEAAASDAVTKRGDSGKLGTFTLARVNRFSVHSGLVANLYTQFSFSENGEDVFEYAHFENGLTKVCGMRGMTFGMPLIGTGLAGGSTNKVLRIIESVAKVTDSTIHVYTQFPMRQS